MMDMVNVKHGYIILAGWFSVASCNCRQGNGSKAHLQKTKVVFKQPTATCGGKIKNKCPSLPFCIVSKRIVYVWVITAVVGLTVS